MPEILENANERLKARMRRLLDFLWQDWKHLQLQIESLRPENLCRNPVFQDRGRGDSCNISALLRPQTASRQLGPELLGTVPLSS